MIVQWILFRVLEVIRDVYMVVVMEGDMPSMVDNVEVTNNHGGQLGGNVVLDKSDVGNGLNERQLAEKLERSEAGRKKLRLAIALLKEKLDATSQALEVNEVLRQQVERERLNFDTERKKAENEKLLREKVEEENLTIKEQFIGVLQRLDFLESSYKADRSEFDRIRLEVKETVGAISSALQAVEATKSLYHSLERSIHAKINGAVQSSSKSLAIAQSGQATTSRAQAAALAAQSLAKAVQKEVQLVSSQVATLQKQASNLHALEASLLQESQLRGPGTPMNSPDSGETNASLAVLKDKVTTDAVSPSNSAPQGIVPKKCQTETQKSSQSIVGSGEADMPSVLVASTEKSRNNLVSSSATFPPRGGMILSRSQIPDGGLKSQTSIPQVRAGVKSPRIGPPESASREECTSNVPPKQLVSTSCKKGPVAIIMGVDSILSPAARIPAPLDSAKKPVPSLYITPSGARTSSLQKQVEARPHKVLDASKGLTNKRPVVRKAQEDLNVAGSNQAMDGCPLNAALRSKNSTGVTESQATTASGSMARNGNCNNLIVQADDISPEGMLQLYDKPCPNAATKLLKSIIKMFQKEEKNRRNMEDKLIALQEALEGRDGSGQTGQTFPKRKRESKKEKDDGTFEEEREKRQRQVKESKKKVTSLSHGDAATSPGERLCTAVDKCLPQENGAQQNDNLLTGDCQPVQDRLSEMISTLQHTCKGEGLFETPGECQESLDVPSVAECKDASDVNVCNEDIFKEETGTSIDLENIDDALGEDWWAKKVLLSPISESDLAT